MTSPERQKLENSINELYEVFAKYPLPRWINCNSHQKNSHIHCLKQITNDDLWRYYEDCELFNLSDDVFKSILPRVFELIAFDDFYSYQFSYNLSISQLGESFEWQHWNRDEQASVKRYLIALWKYVLSEYPSPSMFSDDIAGEISELDDDMVLYIRILEEHCDSLSGIQHLADMVTGQFTYKLHKQSWVLPLLEKTYYEHIDTPIGDLMAMAVKAIEQNG